MSGTWGLNRLSFGRLTAVSLSKLPYLLRFWDLSCNFTIRDGFWPGSDKRRKDWQRRGDVEVFISRPSGTYVICSTFHWQQYFIAHLV